MDLSALRSLGETGYVSEWDNFKAQLRALVETYPLYKKLRVKIPNMMLMLSLERASLWCSICKAPLPFQPPPTVIKTPEEFAALMPKQRKIDPEEFLKSGNYVIALQCVGCRKEEFSCWVQLNIEEGWIQKVGQIPPWVPPIPKDVEKELGEDAELLKRALRCMGENYGIGACAYLRRLLEKHINPLLESLLEIRQEEGAGEEEVAKIREALNAKEFTTKTRYASEIAPKHLLVDGINPFKLIHERLSVGIHMLDEAKASEYAIVIRDALEFIIRGLKKHQQERKAYAAKLKEIRGLNSG